MALSLAGLRRYAARKSARVVFRRSLVICTERPLISFTFDDCPRSSLLAGGAILESFGLVGTYYTSIGLLGKDSPSGQIFVLDDLKAALERGHELGCHTYSHCDAFETKAEVFEASVAENCAALSELVPGAKFKSLSYPSSEPHPRTKRAIAKYFQCCRSGGQSLNIGTVDLNQVSSYFLEKAGGDIHTIANLIDTNTEARGWAVFSTHDVSDHPSQYGCTPVFFEEVVQYAVNSGSLIVPMTRALEVIRGVGRMEQSVLQDSIPHSSVVRGGMR